MANKPTFQAWLATQPSLKTLPYQQQLEAYKSAFPDVPAAPAPTQPTSPILGDIIQSVKAGKPLSEAVPMVAAHTPVSMAANQQAAAGNPAAFDFNPIDNYYNYSNSPGTKPKEDLGTLLSRTKGDLATWASKNPDEFAKMVASYNEEARKNAANTRPGSALDSASQGFQRKNELINDVYNMLSRGQTSFTQKLQDIPKSVINNALNLTVPDKTPAQPVTAPAPIVDQSVAAPPMPEKPVFSEAPAIENPEPAAPHGIDWNKVGEIAKNTGKSVIDILQAAIAGRTAGLQGRALDFDKETLAGKEAIERAEKDREDRAAAADEKSFNRGADLQKQLRQIDQDFAAGQDSLKMEYEDKIRNAQTAEDKAAKQLEYQQRLKELQISGQQRMAEIAAGKQPAKTGTGDSLGIR